MQKSVWNLPTPKRREETKTFRDSASGWEITVTLREPDVLMQADIQDYAEELEKYWTARDEQGNRRVFLAPGEEKGLELPAGLVTMLAGLERLQPGPGRVPFEELLGISLKLPDLFADLLEWAGSYLPGGKEGETAGNSLGAGAAPSSAPPSMPDSGTPTSTPTTTPPSGASTSASAPCAAEADAPTPE